MPHKGRTDPIMSDGPGFHSNIPVSELTERVTRAIEASDVSSTPPVAKNHGWGDNHKDEPTLNQTLLRAEARGKLDSQGDQTCGHRMMAQILGRGYVRKQKTLSPTSFAILSSIFSDTRPQQRRVVGSHSGADKVINTPFLK